MFHRDLTFLDRYGWRSLLAWSVLGLIALVMVSSLIAAAASAQTLSGAAGYNPDRATTLLVCTAPEPIAQYVPTRPRELTDQKECQQIFPQQFIGISIFAGPLKDWEGDNFYIAQYRGFYFPIWPGHNAPPIPSSY